MNYYSEIIIPIITAIVGGIVTHFFDLQNERRKEKKEALMREEEQRVNRPEFLITSMEDYFDYPGKYISDSNFCDMEVFVAIIKDINVKDDIVYAMYDDEIFDKKTWVCREYTLKNVGKTVVYETAIISTFKKNNCIFDINMMAKKFVNSEMINYYEIIYKRIAPNESFTLKIYYNKDKISYSLFSAGFHIGMMDDNGNYWVQPFFAPEDKLYESKKISHKEFRDSILPDKAIECFKNPYLW